MTGILPHRQAQLLSRIEPFGFIIILFLIFYTDLWRIVLSPAVSLLVGVLAGPEVVMVERAMHFLFGR
jgi:hypothetical protein